MCRCMRAFITIIIVGILKAGELAPDLAEKLKSSRDDAVFHVYILPDEQPDYLHLKSVFGSDKKAIADYLRDFANRTQKDIIDFLRKRRDVTEIKSFWVANAIEASLSKKAILDLLTLPEVGYIEEVPIIRIARENPRPDHTSVSQQRSPEWNISKINADDVWNMGYLGQGVIVGHMDTGVDYTHPALSGKWTGYWKDCVNGTTTPYDDNGHGTHTMGVILGGDGPGSFSHDIGVAPEAQFVAAKIFDSEGNSHGILQAFEWFASLVADSSIPIRVISNSWGITNPTALTYWDAVLTWRNLDIIPVFAVGNDGPNSETVTPPGNYPTTIGVGATDVNDNVASFSSRGPAPNQHPWTDPLYWPRPDWNRIKPDICAPGVSITSSVPGGGYEGGYLWSGTSMATPHVAGVVALMLSKNPTLDFDTVYNILTNTAYQPSGHSYPNNDYGWGRVDALAAINAVPSLDQPEIILVDYVVEAGGDNIIEPGESGRLWVYVTNISQVEASGVTAVLRSQSEWITVQDSIADYGDIANGDTVCGAQPFHITADSSAPTGTNASLVLHLESNGGAYNWDIAFSIIVGIERFDYADVHAGSALLTVTDIGALGYMSSEQTQGSGFIYPYPGTSVLYYGSFAAGNSESYVVDAWFESDGGDDRDWNPTDEPNGRLYYIPDPPRRAREAVWGAFEDSGHPSAKGLRAYQLAYAYDQSNFDDFIIIEYVLKNDGNETIRNLYAGIFMDYDIDDYSTNSGAIDESARIAYMWSSSIYAGVKLLYPETPANLSVITNEDYIYPYQGMPDSIQFKFMNGTYHIDSHTSPTDLSVVASAGPFTLAPGDSQVVAFAIVGGTSESDIILHAYQADSVYNDTTLIGVEEKTVSLDGGCTLLLSSTISKGLSVITFGVDRTERVKLGIYDAAGRIVKKLLDREMPAGTYTLKWDGTDDAGKTLSSGVYFVRMETPKARKTAKLLLLK